MYPDNIYHITRTNQKIDLQLVDHSSSLLFLMSPEKSRWIKDKTLAFKLVADVSINS
jgi:hypothetical protein